MKKTPISIIAAALMLASGTQVLAQDDVEVNVSADLVSNYIWRGDKLDDAAVQPTLGVSYKGVSLSAWGSYGLTTAGKTSELDLTLAYSVGNLNIGITDYFVNGDRYFYYNTHETTHVFEANVGYDFGPLSIQWYTNFAGSDYFKADGKRSYSSYVELNAPFKLGGVDWNATLGAVPFKAAESAYSGCSNSTGFAVTNIALKAAKDVKITDTFSLPLFAQIVANPSTQKAYFTLGVTIQP